MSDPYAYLQLRRPGELIISGREEHIPDEVIASLMGIPVEQLDSIVEIEKEILEVVADFEDATGLTRDTF